MPKNKKSKDERRIQTEREEKLASFWSGRIKAAQDRKKDYVDTADDVKSYLRASHTALYEDATTRTAFMDFRGASAVSVPKIAQMKNSLGPRLYMAKPERNVAYRGDDNVLLGLARVLQTYLTYTARETNQAAQIRACVDDGLVRGRQVLRQVWDDVRRIVTSVYLSSLDVVFDPDFDDPHDAQWIAIRHREPLWQVKRRIPRKARTNDLEKVAYEGKPDDMDDRDADAPDKTYTGRTARVVEWWEVLSRMGCGFRGVEFEADDYPDDGNDFVRLEVVIGHPKLLDEGDWTIPLYLDRDWPISWKDFIEVPDTAWPESVAGQVLSCQKAIDLLTSLRLGSCKNRDRVVVAVSAELDKEAQGLLRNGTSADFLPVRIPPGMNLDSIMKVLDFGTGSPESSNERMFLLAEMETAMGATQLVTGGQDNSPQDRSATASNLRNSATETRIGDFKTKVEELYTDASRKEALMVRLWLEAEDVAPFVKPKDLGLYCVAVELPDAPAMPIRNVYVDEDGRPKVRKPPLTVQDLDPASATYFDKPEDAGQAALKVWQAIQGSLDMRVVQLRDALLQGMQPVDPMTGMPPILPPGISVDVVTVERVWADTSGMTAEELMRELSYEIASGSGIKFNRETEQKNVDTLLQTLLPVVAQTGDITGINGLLNMRYEAYEVPEDKRFFLQPPPPPATPEDDQGEDKGKDKKGPPK